MEHLALNSRLKGAHDVSWLSRLSGPFDGMRTKLDGDEVDDALPIRMLFGIQTERNENIGRRPAVTKDPRTILAAHREGLVPLDGAQVIWNRGGHLIALR